MNRKNRGLMLAVLLGILLFALTCGAALAEPPTFYVKMENTTNYAIKLKWHFSTRAGENASSDSITTIPPHSTQRFQGRPGLGRMNYKFHTGGEGSPIKEQTMDGVTDPKASGAYCLIKYDNRGVGIYKKITANAARSDDF